MLTCTEKIRTGLANTTLAETSTKQAISQHINKNVHKIIEEAFPEGYSFVPEIESNQTSLISSTINKLCSSNKNTVPMQCGLHLVYYATDYKFLFFISSFLCVALQL